MLIVNRLLAELIAGKESTNWIASSKARRSDVVRRLNDLQVITIRPTTSK